MYLTIATWGYAMLVGTNNGVTANLVLGDYKIVPDATFSTGKLLLGQWTNEQWLVVGVVLLLCVVVFVLYVKYIKVKVALRQLKTQTVQYENRLANDDEMLKEIHHRVKNNLQLISGILEFQYQYNTEKRVEVVMRESQNRVKTLALVYQALFQNENLREVPIKTYIQKLGSYLISTLPKQNRDVNLDLKFDDFGMNIDQTIPMALILNELLDNAFRHGRNREGISEVEVRFVSVPNGKCELVVKDNGQGLPEEVDLQHPKTMGLALVKMLTEQVKAQFIYRKNSGSEFKIILNIKSGGNVQIENLYS